MTTDEVIQRLKTVNRAEVSRATGLPYMYLSRLAWGVIKDPGASKLDKLRNHFLSEDVKATRQ